MAIRAATASDLEHFKGQSLGNRAFLVIANPVTVAAGTIGTPPSSNNSVITVNWTHASGTLADVKLDMTCLIGSTAGASDKGIVRIRKAPTASLLYIGETSEVAWSAGLHVTILEDWSIWTKHIVVPDGDDLTSILLDGDIAYTNQHQYMNPVVNIGGHRALWLTGSTVSVSIQGSIQNVGSGSISTWAWSCPRSFSSSGTTTSNPSFTFNATGTYWVTCIVTLDNGAAYSTHRAILVLGTNNLPHSCYINNCNGSRDSAAWNFEVTALDDAGPTRIRDRALGLLVSFDYWENGEETYIVPGTSGEERVVAFGWSGNEVLEPNKLAGDAIFRFRGPAYWLRNVPVKLHGVEDTNFADNGGGLPDTWVEIQNLTGSKAIWALLSERTTLFRVCDGHILGFNDLLAQTSARGKTIWGQLEYITQEILGAKAVFDRYGALWVERLPALLTQTERNALTTIMDIGPEYRDNLTIQRRTVADIGYAEISGIVYAAPNSIPIGAKSPGDVPSRLGAEELIFSNMALPNNQDEIKERAGWACGSGSGPISFASVNLAATNKLMDIAPLAYVKLTVASEDNPRNIQYTSVKCFIEAVTHQMSGDTGFLDTSVDLTSEGIKLPAISMVFPNEGEPPIEPPSIPPVTPPSPPSPPGPPNPPPAPGTGDAIVVTASDVRVTADLSAGTPTWTSIISGGPSAPIDSDVVEGHLDPLYVIEASKVWKCTDPFGTPVWTQILDASGIDDGELTTLSRIRVCPGIGSVIYVLGNGVYTGVPKPIVFRTINGGASWNHSWIPDTLPEAKPYTMDYQQFTIYHDNYAVNGEIEFTRKGDDVATYNPWAMMYRVTSTLSNTWSGPAGGDNTRIHDWYDSTSEPLGYYVGTANKLMNATDQATAEGWMTENGWTGWPPGGPTCNFPKESQRTKVVFYASHCPTWETATIQVWMFWALPELAAPKAIDVARTNYNWVYVGTKNRIWKSVDGGINWIPSVEDHGSNDICVDPQLAGVYYHWSDAGNLEQVIADVVTGSAFDTETPVETPLRLKRDLNSGRIWVLNSSTALKMRNLGTWSTLDSGLLGARALQSYLGGKLMYLDNGDIYYSGDYGVTQALKKGGWSTYASPINVHLGS